jgi:hypothetical protein
VRKDWCAAAEHSAVGFKCLAQLVP